MAKRGMNAGISLKEDKVRELVQKRAYEISQKRGCVPGNEWGDWFEAERQVKQELHIR